MRESKIWGDAFVDDSWRELILVRDWILVSANELVRPFPALAPRDGQVPGPVPELVRARMAAIGACLQMAAEKHSAVGASRLPLGDNGCGGRAVTTTLSGAAASTADAEFLRSVVSPEAAGATCDGGEHDMVRFAYLTGVHPAYFWPAVATLANWGATAAWLGAMARCGAAPILEEVADYLADLMLLGPDGFAKIRDPLIANLVCGNVDLAELLRAEACWKFASPDDPAAWLAHFAALVGSISLRMELRACGLQRVKRFSWAESSQAYLHLYEHLK